jgi:hypothetical protein
MAVHGIGNLLVDRTPDAAAMELARRWRTRLRAGYRAAGLTHAATPDVVAGYYAYLLADGPQGANRDLARLDPAQQRVAWTWMQALGVPAEATEQGLLTVPLRQGLDWLARRRGSSQQILARIMAAFLNEVHAYTTRPATRRRVRAEIIGALHRYRPRVIVAHSLGSVVVFEALHAAPGVEVDLLLTLGSPLGLPGAIFETLDPEPVGGRGLRPPGVRRWVNIADPGDIIAVPRRLGDRFDVDIHGEANIGVVDFHTLGSYLSCGLTAAAVSPYA